MSEQDKLLGIRNQIDAIDLQIQDLINQRAECARQVAEIKIKSGETEHFYRPEREAQVLMEIKNVIRVHWAMMPWRTCSVKSCLPAWHWNGP